MSTRIIVHVIYPLSSHTERAVEAPERATLLRRGQPVVGNRISSYMTQHQAITQLSSCGSHAHLPPGGVRNDRQGSHKERKEEEKDEDGFHLSRPA